MPIIFVWELPTLRILQCGRVKYGAMAVLFLSIGRLRNWPENWLNGFTALQKVDCSRNQLTEINVSNCTALNTLNVLGTIVGLNMNNCPALIEQIVIKSTASCLSPGFPV